MRTPNPVATLPLSERVYCMDARGQVLVRDCVYDCTFCMNVWFLAVSIQMKCGLCLNG